MDITDSIDTTLQSSCDVLVVGGGINGVGIARDLAGRGLKVILAEKDDLASHTSSASTKLIHGGLRYLEHGEFTLVRKALQEREVLLRNAPHITRPMSFILPHEPQMRPVWMIRLGLFLYDHLAYRAFLPGSRHIRLSGDAMGAPLHDRYTQGFIYSDGWVDDSRLVVLNAMDIRARGGLVQTRTACTRVQRGQHEWLATLSSSNHEVHTRLVRARYLVNATGPWAAGFLNQINAQTASAAASQPRRLRLVKGSHIVVPRLFDHDHAYIFQARDGRVIFALPYEQNFTMIGTTDVELGELMGRAQATREEITYLCEQVNHYFKRSVSERDVRWSFAGVRPLLDDEADNASALTRDYALEACAQGAPMLTVWGGKITTYRKLAEEAADQVCQALGVSSEAWTAHVPLPGGRLCHQPTDQCMPGLQLDQFITQLQHMYAWIPKAWLERWARAYGTHVHQIIGEATSMRELGLTDVPGICMAELLYLVQNEWAQTGEDILWRRSKLGLHLSQSQQSQVDVWIRDLVSPWHLTRQLSAAR